MPYNFETCCEATGVLALLCFLISSEDLRDTNPCWSPIILSRPSSVFSSRSCASPCKSYRVGHINPCDRCAVKKLRKKGKRFECLAHSFILMYPIVPITMPTTVIRGMTLIRAIRVGGTDDPDPLPPPICTGTI